MLNPEPRHLALLYSDEEEYVRGVLRFAAPAVEAGEPVAIVVPGPKAELLDERLREFGAEPEVLDMGTLGRNPARIIPAVESIRAGHAAQTLHYVGEPVWPERSPEEIREAIRHEALMNVAWPDHHIRLLCAFDAAGLETGVLEEARRTHPHLITNGDAAASPSYQGPMIPQASDQPLPDPPAGAVVLPFDLAGLPTVRMVVAARGAGCGLGPERVSDLVVAVNELAANSIRHGGGQGLLRMWTTAVSLVCQIEDSGHITDPLAGRRIPAPDAGGAFGLWTVNQVADLVAVRSSPAGTAIRVHFHLG